VPNTTYPCLAEDGSGAFSRYRVRVTPFAFVLSEDGRVVAKGLCNSAARLRALLLAGGLLEAARAVAAEPTVSLIHHGSSIPKAKEVVG